MIKVDIDLYSVLLPLQISKQIIILNRVNNQIITKCSFNLEIVESNYGFEPSEYINIGLLLTNPVLTTLVDKIQLGHSNAHSPINIIALSIYLDQCLSLNSPPDFAIAATSLKDWEVVSCIEQYDKYLKLNRRHSSQSIYLLYPPEVTIFSLWSSFNLSVSNFESVSCNSVLVH